MLRCETKKYQALLCPESEILRASAFGTPPLLRNVSALERTDAHSWLSAIPQSSNTINDY